MFKSVIILAAGQGKRMNTDKNKQFMEVEGKPILAYTIEAFLKTNIIDEIIIVINSSEIELITEKVLKKYFKKKYSEFKIIIGGEQRYNSVYNGLKSLDEKSEYVLIHDGARPLVSTYEINKSIEGLVVNGACVLGVKAKNTYKQVDNQLNVINTIPRESLYSILTPQSFHKSIIVAAYNLGINDAIGITDDGMMVEKFGEIPVKIIEGSYENIKITTPEDLILMKKIIETRKKKSK